ncbi:MAG: GGDEF domain-containing protein [Henriciella sp.]|nr:GGDEF domain-containing protein [Henriciella sp.]
MAEPVETPIDSDPLPGESQAEPVNARRRLIGALGVDLASLPKQVQAALEALAGEVLSLREERAALQTALETAELLADRDALCPLFNRRAFERELTREIALAQRYGTPLCLIYIDLDNFKLVNDRFGHATGDDVLKHVAGLLVKSVRQTDIVGRLGGDEFALVLTHAELADSQAKAALLERLIEACLIRDTAAEHLEPIQLGASCGTVEWSRGMTAEVLINLADETMFRTKAARKAAVRPDPV